MRSYAENRTLVVDDGEMDYIVFGRGDRPLAMLPGLGDGLSTVRGKALPFALAYRTYAREYRVYLFSRKTRLEKNTSIRDMARAQGAAMAALGLSHAAVLGVSQGGMVAQHLAAGRPELVDRLVLAVTSARQNPVLQRVVGRWMELARQGRYRELVIDTAEHSYSEGYLRRYRPLYPLLTRVGRPKDFRRFLIQAAACLRHDAREELDRISCPVLVIGGTEDRIVGPEAAPELAECIPDSRLFLYEGFGHAAYEEGRDFHARVQSFFRT